jgi:hypothetical protein
MKVLYRVVQHIYTDKWAELEVYEKEVTELEAKYNFPLETKKRYRMLSGPDNLDTLNVEYEWESLAAFEAGMEKLMADPSFPEINVKGLPIVKDMSIELFWVLPS